MSSLNDIFNDAVGSSIKLKYDPGAQLNLQVGKKFLKDMDIEYDAKALQMMKVLRKEIKRCTADDENKKVLKGYQRMLKKYSSA